MSVEKRVSVQRLIKGIRPCSNNYVGQPRAIAVAIQAKERRHNIESQLKKDQSAHQSARGTEGTTKEERSRVLKRLGKISVVLFQRAWKISGGASIIKVQPSEA